ncbi:MAG: type II toxin-antitoxin system HicB family antitoxin [Chloroflexota bacterium]|nr:type II toxin-antitoxin system HicB family antitoxin [Chloroflexota bacterium]
MLIVAWSEEDGVYIATCPVFPGVSAFGDTPQQAIQELNGALDLAVETYEAEGWTLPTPTYATPEATPSVRLPTNAA